MPCTHNTHVPLPLLLIWRFVQYRQEQILGMHMYLYSSFCVKVTHIKCEGIMHVYVCRDGSYMCDWHVYVCNVCTYIMYYKAIKELNLGRASNIMSKDIYVVHPNVSVLHRAETLNCLLYRLRSLTTGCMYDLCRAHHPNYTCTCRFMLSWVLLIYLLFHQAQYSYH